MSPTKHEFSSKPSDAHKRRMSGVGADDKPHVAAYANLNVSACSPCRLMTLINHHSHPAYVGWHSGCLCQWWNRHRNSP